MSLLPLILRDMMSMSRPLRMLENHMRMTEELLQPFMNPMIRGQRRPTIDFQEEPENVILDKDKFQVKVDVQNFAPQEITVKAVDGNTIQIEGKHEEKQDNSGYISRHFIRKFVVPQGHEMKDVISSLSSDGILTVTAPKKIDPSLQERVIEITHSGPERGVEQKKEITHSSPEREVDQKKTASELS